LAEIPSGHGDREVTGTFDKPRAPPKTTKQIYKTMIRPLMEYAPMATILSKDEELEALRIKAYKIAHGIPNYNSKRYLRNDLTPDTPRKRIEDLCKRYINNGNRAPGIRQLINEARDKLPYRPRGAYKTTPRGKILELQQ